MVFGHVFLGSYCPIFPKYSSALSSISILALGLKLARVVDTGSTLPDCSNFSCFKPHEP